LQDDRGAGVPGVYVTNRKRKKKRGGGEKCELAKNKLQPAQNELGGGNRTVVPKGNATCDQVHIKGKRAGKKNGAIVGGKRSRDGDKRGSRGMGGVLVVSSERNTAGMRRKPVGKGKKEELICQNEPEGKNPKVMGKPIVWESMGFAKDVGETMA